MNRLLSWLLMVVVGVMVIIFCVSNRELVALDYWPLPFSHTTPIFLPVLVVGFLSFISGGLIAWLSAGGARSKARKAKRRVSNLEKDLNILQSKIYELENKN